MLNAVPFPRSVALLIVVVLDSLIVVLLESLIVDMNETADGRGVFEVIDVRSESDSRKFAWATAP